MIIPKQEVFTLLGLIITYLRSTDKGNVAGKLEKFRLSTNFSVGAILLLCNSLYSVLRTSNYIRT